MAASEAELDPRKLKNLYRAFEDADYILSKRYRYILGDQPVCVLPQAIQNIKIGDNFQIFHILKLVYDKNENTQEKLTTAYHTLTAYAGASIIMLLISDGYSTELYGGIACRDIGADGQCDSGKRGSQFSTLHSALESNFPGGEFACYDVAHNKNFNRAQLIDHAFHKKGVVSAVTGVAAARRAQEQKNEEFVQGIEKLIDSMRGKPFTAILIADCMPITKIESICADYEDIYSQLSPFVQSQQTVGKSDGTSDTESVIKGITDTTNESVTASESHGIASGTFKSATATATAGVNSPVSSAQVSIAGSIGTNKSTSDTKGQAKTTGSAKSLSTQNSVAKAMAKSTNEGLQITHQNRAVKALMDRIDEQIKRLRNCEDYGVYDFGAYFIAETTPISQTAAAIYNSLMRGEKSSVEASAINTWSGDEGKIAIEYLKRMYHPQIALPSFGDSPEDSSKDSPTQSLQSITPTTLVSGKELPIHMSLPKKSVQGIAILECAEFGREAVIYTGAQEDGIFLGKTYHMRKPTNSLLGLRKSSLTAHTFITGSTGAGKSNTIYTLLDRLCLSGKSDTHFLVIEPAKGEYKDTLGGYKGVSVYGTNPKKTQLLRLNPFAFPEDIHVLEHIDRLIEIFNACWPMYAAMPAVLKSAVENAYSNVGWSLNASSNPSGRVPTFRDVMDALPQVIRTKGFSKDTQGDYEGALLTRVESLTNGINGQVLCSCDPVQDEALFDENVIVDLSRVGSMETKALLMGILVLKLQEHRMAQRSAGKNKPNSGLAHITVLEEAHNLLRRTSSEQSQESANLQGKSVEMLTNAIAELRSFGEGFVIADQSPGLLDMAVIRNTNTKIIMRLPDEGDRQLVGRAAGLNDDQIVELSKLETGVAAIYQNEWLEPVLCKVDRFGDEKVKPFDYKKQPPDAGSFYPTMFSLLCGQTDYRELTKEQVDAFYRWVERISIREELKETLCTAVEDKKQVPNPDATLYVLVSGDTLFKATSNETPTDTIAQRLMERYQLDNLELVRLMSEHLVNMQIRLGRMEQTASSIEKMPGERWR